MSGFKAGDNGSYTGPGKTSTISRQANNVTGTDPVGVAGGLSARMGFNAEDAGPMADYARDPLTGNATERVEPYGTEKVSSKGVSFDLIG